jgi:uncharacterized protein involved in exopolysaccharide biosynthesis
VNPELDRYSAILKSGRVMGAVIQKFDLVHVYGNTTNAAENTAKELLGNVEIKEEDEGYLSISVYDKSPQRAADMANYFVEMLNKTNAEILAQNARSTRQFLEERYHRNLADLSSAEDSLRIFQTKFGVVALPEQLKASIDAAANLYGQMAKEEVQMNVLKRMQSSDDPSIQAAEARVEEYRRKLSQLSGGSLDHGEQDVVLPLKKMPELGSEYMRRYRSVEIQYRILQLVTPLLEQARVEEQRATPSVMVLDKAAPAEHKAKPKVALFVALALVLSTMISFFIVFGIVAIKKIRLLDPQRFHTIVELMKSDWGGLGRLPGKKKTM